MSKLDNLIGKKVLIREFSPETIHNGKAYLGVIDEIRKQLIRVINCIQGGQRGGFRPCDGAVNLGTRWFNMAASTFQSLDELED